MKKGEFIIIFPENDRQYFAEYVGKKRVKIDGKYKMVSRFKPFLRYGEVLGHECNWITLKEVD